jgi:hypothetical protein
MRIAATVGAERLREIMAELVDGAKQVVRRYEGTVDKFTGDGSWRCSERRRRWRTTRCGPVWRPWAFRRRRNVVIWLVDQPYEGSVVVSTSTKAMSTTDLAGQHG